MNTIVMEALKAALEVLEENFPMLAPNDTTHDMAIWVACQKLRTAIAIAPYSPAAVDLLLKMSTPHALEWGGTFIRYESKEEAAFNELQQAGLVETFSLHNYGFKARLKPRPADD